MFPQFLKPISNWFRHRRNAPLIALIDQLAETLDRPPHILDVGGSFVFWSSIPNRGRCAVTLLNTDEAAYGRQGELGSADRSIFQTEIGDARNLERWSSGHFDLVVCNSVLEHVGTWKDMRTAAAEIRRVGIRGWVQVPAFEFPLEQHFLLPFVHWFPEQLMSVLIWTLRRDIRKYGWEGVREIVTYTRPIPRWEFRRLFPSAKIVSEWFTILPKSHIAVW